MQAKARLAVKADVAGIARVCSEGYRRTYPRLLRPETIEGVISRYYEPERIGREIAGDPPAWLGYVVAEGEDGQVTAAGGGGLTAEDTGELFVLYTDPDKRGRGYGSAVLDVVTQQQVALGAREQWVSVMKGNDLAIPFYESRGFAVVEEVEPWDGTGVVEGARSLRMKRSLK